MQRELVSGGLLQREHVRPVHGSELGDVRDRRRVLRRVCVGKRLVRDGPLRVRRGGVRWLL